MYSSAKIFSFVLYGQIMRLISLKLLYAKRHYLYIITYTEENFYCFRKLFFVISRKIKNRNNICGFIKFLRKY